MLLPISTFPLMRAWSAAAFWHTKRVGVAGYSGHDASGARAPGMLIVCRPALPSPWLILCGLLVKANALLVYAARDTVSAGPRRPLPAVCECWSSRVRGDPDPVSLVVCLSRRSHRRP
jgi:hypothetical protein